jgi:lipoprotein signal peptidase
MRILAIVISVLLLIGFDMSSKYFIEEKVFGTRQSICSSPETNSTATREYCEDDRVSLVGEYLGIELSYNTGVAFSLPIRGLALQILTILLICGIIYQYIREEYTKKSKLLDIGYALILA